MPYLSLTGHSDVKLMEWAEAPSFGAAVAVSSRHGGTSNGSYESLNLGLHVGDDPDRVITNRNRAADAFGTELKAMIFAQQVHGAHAAVVHAADQGRGTISLENAIAATDILITTTRGTTLAILVADCVPLALIDPEAGVLAVVHAGWRGTAARASRRAIEAMQTLGASPSNVVAFIGPGAHPARYQVGKAVYEALAHAAGPEGLEDGVAVPDGPDQWRIDLMAANSQQLRASGVMQHHVFDCGVTTADDDFFSDRAARPCGRFALLARLADSSF